jgi:hypothetical protein
VVWSQNIHSHPTNGNFVTRTKYSTEIRECDRCFATVGRILLNIRKPGKHNAMSSLTHVKNDIIWVSCCSSAFSMHPYLPEFNLHLIMSTSSCWFSFSSKGYTVKNVTQHTHCLLQFLYHNESTCSFDVLCMYYGFTDHLSWHIVGEGVINKL